MVLKTLDAMGPMHGYGLARRIEQISEDALLVNQGTIYLCLIRLVQKRWISAKWGTSENNRKAKFYAITKAGRKQLQAEASNWERLSGVIGRLLRPLAERIAMWTAITRLAARFAAMFRHRAEDSELDQEMDAHRSL
jgi:transcriptional regulator